MARVHVGRFGPVRAACPPLDDEALRRLPKAHLHLHLVGSMRRTTLAEWCERDGRALPSLDLGSGGWARFHSLYEAASASVRNAADLCRLVDELVEDQARDGARWVEITADPGNYRGRIGTPDAVMQLLLDAGRQAGARHGVEVAWVVCANRSRPAADALELARLAEAHAGTEVVGFGLANDERAAPTGAFVAAFDVARDAGLVSVPHAGELCGPASVREAVDLLGAERIGHGVRALEEPAVLELLRSRGVTLEVCPTSNLALGVYEAAWAASHRERGGGAPGRSAAGRGRAGVPQRRRPLAVRRRPARRVPLCPSWPRVGRHRSGGVGGGVDHRRLLLVVVAAAPAGRARRLARGLRQSARAAVDSSAA
ncbi:MAG: adenosine deaminase family protein [Acidimicrobiales bacterium]